MNTQPPRFWPSRFWPSGFWPSRLLRAPARLAVALAQRAKRAEDWARAARHYRAALACVPGNGAVWIQYGNALKECGAPAEAERAYRRALEFAPGNADAHLQLGHALKLQRRGNEAAAAYGRAAALDPLLHHAALELLALGAAAPAGMASVPAAPAGAQSPSARRRPLVVFDASDLLNHLSHARSVSGIQRVQLGIVASLLRDPEPSLDLAIAWFDQREGRWTEIPADVFRRLAALARSPGRDGDLAWREALRELIALFVHGTPIRFRDGAALVALGASWTEENYFLRIRAVKARYRLRYLPFVHDCIPAILPQFCDRQTLQDYLGWASGVFDHADAFLANSAATAQDLTRLSATFGRAIEPPTVIRLDARFSDDGELEPEPGSAAAGRAGNDRARRPFVLFVSSFEPRKNHIAAFRAWQDLIRRRGGRRTPLLICVGSRRWMVEPAMAMLRSNPALRRRVRILSGISDGALHRLYDDCLFTLYPSLYEGWGLPVTESLSHGRIPLVGSAPALREAGGDFAEYFDPDRDGDLLGRLERLIDDSAYRACREAAIRDGFRARSWRDLARDVLDAVQRLPVLPAEDGAANGPRAPAIAVGRHYPLSRNTAAQPERVPASGEVYRVGDGWWAPESWGCWMKPDGAEMEFPLPPDRGDLLWLRLLLAGNPVAAGEATISMIGTPGTLALRLAPDQRVWAALRIPPSSPAGGVVRVRLIATARCDFALSTDGMDRRHVGIGLCGVLFAIAPGEGQSNGRKSRHREAEAHG